MGQYKVPQNVEAEDKIVGPLTLKQFIYLIIGVGWAVISFLIFRTFIPLVVVVGAPVSILFLMLALYRKDGQDFEQLLVALVGYFSQSRERIWTKEPIIESFKVEPVKPKVEQTQRSPQEVRSQLDRLATVVDARGWAEKHDQDGILAPDQGLVQTHQDRLVSPSVPAGSSITTSDGVSDVLDLENSTLAQNLNAMIEKAAQDVKQEAIDSMKKKMASPPTISKSSDQVKPVEQKVSTGPARIGDIKSDKPIQQPAGPQDLSPNISVTPPVSSDIIKLATERDDLTISQLAVQASRIVPLTEGESVSIINGKNASTGNKPAI